MHIPPDIGSISSKELFYSNDLDLVKNSLTFSFDGEFMNGENFEYNLVLDVKKAI